MNRRWWPAVAVAGAILVFSLVPLGESAPITAAGDIAVGGIGADKLLHVVDYAGLALALCYGLRAQTARACLVAFAAAVVFGGAIELLQIPLATRQFSLLDAAANTVGAGVASIGWWVVEVRRRGSPAVRR